jgi:hypothetical protein
MKPPLFIRPLSAAEARELKAGLRSRDAFSAGPRSCWRVPAAPAPPRSSST